MPEEAEAHEAPDEVQATPTETPGEQDTSQQEIDWQKRYNDLRPEYDRATQFRSQFEADPDAFLRAHGYEVADDEEDTPEGEYYDEEDTGDEYAQRLERLESTLAEQSEAQQRAEFEQMENSFIGENIGQLMQEHGVDLTDEEVEYIGDTSKLYRDDQGVPDVKAAWEAQQTMFKHQLERVRKSKNSPQAPRGGAGKSAPDLDNPQERDDYMAQRLAQLSQDND
jgi:hypothetical protein